MGIPLPALSIKPPQQPDTMGDIGRVVQLKNLLQAGQANQLAIQEQQNKMKDQEAMTAALHQWDGKDPDALPGLIMKSGGSAQAVLGMKDSIIKQKQAVANLDDTVLKDQQTKNDLLAGHIKTVVDAPDDQLIPTLQRTVSEAAQTGLMTPQQAAQAQQLYNLTPDQIRNQLSVIEKGLIGHKQLIDMEQRNRQIVAQEKAAKARELAGKKPTEASLAVKAAQGDEEAKKALELMRSNKLTDQDKALQDYLAAHNLSDTSANRDKARAAIASRNAEIRAAAGMPNVGSTATPESPESPNAEGKNPEVLARLDPGIAAQVKALADGRMQFPSGFALRSKYWAHMIQLVAQYDPTFDATNYNIRAQTRKDFSTGKAANNIRSLNTAIGHLNTLEEAAKELNNGGIPLWNSIANLTLREVGDPRVVKFNNAANAVAGELATIFKNTSGTDQEIKAWRDQLSSSMSPRQINAALHQLIGLMGSRMGALSNQWKVGMGRSRDFHLLSPESIKILNGIGAKSLVEEDKPPLVEKEMAPKPQKTAPSASTGKIATMDDVRAFAKLHNMTLDQAKKAAIKAGYSINGQ